MRNAICFFLVLLCACKNKNSGKNIPTEEFETYISSTDFKTQLTLHKDSTFDYVNVSKRNLPEGLFFATKGRWKNYQGKIVLNSITDSVPNEVANVQIIPTKDTGYSQFRFYDVFNDSVGIWYVIYPDGTETYRGRDVQDDTYSWDVDLRKLKSIRFVFTGYPVWKYITSDNQNHTVIVQLNPVFRPNAFIQEVFRKQGDSLFETSNNIERVFVRKRNKP